MAQSNELIERSPVSGRDGIVSDEGDSVWLYLSDPARREIVADVWLYNKIAAPPAASLERARYQEADRPPPAVAEVLDDGAKAAVGGDFSKLRLEWAPDGEAVAVWRGVKLLGYVAAAERVGRNPALREKCFWGAPLDPVSFDQTFGFDDTRP